MKITLITYFSTTAHVLAVLRAILRASIELRKKIIHIKLNSKVKTGNKIDESYILYR